MKGNKGIRVNRPLIWVTIAHISGLVLSKYTNIDLDMFLIVSIFIFLIFSWVLWGRSKNIFPAILIAFIIIGTLSGQLYYNRVNPLNEYAGENILVTGRIIDSPRYNGNREIYSIISRSIKINDKTIANQEKILVTVYTDRKDEDNFLFSQGDIINIRGELRQPHGPRNPKGFDYREYLRNRGFFNVMSVGSNNIEYVGRGSTGLINRWIYNIRNNFEYTIDNHVGGREGELLRAMLLGDKWLISDETNDMFARTGLSHILAISGLHVGFIVLMLRGITKATSLSPLVSFMINLGVLIVYCLIVGFSPSIIRASIMAAVYLGGKTVGRKGNSLNSMAFAALIILIINPGELFQAGFQLSFTAVSGIIFLKEPIQKRLSYFPDWLSSSLALIISAQLGVWPLIAYYYNVFSVVSFLSNIILVPLAGIIVMLGFIMIVAGGLFPFLAQGLGVIVRIPCVFILEVIRVFDSIPYGSFRIISPTYLFLFCYYLILCLISKERLFNIRRKWVFMASIIMIYMSLSIFSIITPKDLKITFVDVGQGDCIYIGTPDGKNILVDAGGKRRNSPDYYDVGDRIVVPFLLKNRIGKLDLVIMSHDHEDHNGGLVSVLKSIPVDVFMEYPPGNASDIYMEIKELTKQKGIREIHGYAGQSYRIGKGTYMDVIYPDKEEELPDRLINNGENNRSLVLVIKYGEASIMLTGDMEKEVEYYLSTTWMDSVDILKVAHHGSRTSTTEGWIEIINPGIGVIQVGNNTFGHPHSETLSTLENNGVEIFRNDMHGAVTCIWDGEEWHIQHMLN